MKPHQWNDWNILFKLIVNINCCVGGGCATHWGLFTWVVYESSSVFAESHTKGFLLFAYTIGHPCDNKSLFRCNWNGCGEYTLTSNFLHCCSWNMFCIRTNHNNPRLLLIRLTNYNTRYWTQQAYKKRELQLEKFSFVQTEQVKLICGIYLKLSYSCQQLTFCCKCSVSRMLILKLFELKEKNFILKKTNKKETKKWLKVVVSKLLRIVTVSSNVNFLYKAQISTQFLEHKVTVPNEKIYEKYNKLLTEASVKGMIWFKRSVLSAEQVQQASPSKEELHFTSVNTVLRTVACLFCVCPRLS